MITFLLEDIVQVRESKEYPYVNMVSHWEQLGNFTNTHTHTHTHTYMKVKVKVAQFCLTLYNPMGYTDHGVLQARVLEWGAFPFSRVSSQPGD